MKTYICFQKPKAGGYIGGVTTLCNDYMDRHELFLKSGVDINFFNYELPNTFFYRNITNSKFSNILYGLKQTLVLKKILRGKNSDALHIHTSRKALFFKDVLLAQAVRSVFKGKILMTIHVGDINTVFHNDKTRNFLIKLINKNIDKVIFLSERMRKQFIDAGLSPQRSSVLYNFYNIHPISPEKKNDNEMVRLLFLGSINREKGVIELLNAIKNLDGCHLDLCGTIIEESIRPEFETLLSNLGDKVTYHGYVNKEQKENLLRQTDILVLPSYREGLPISILEAMATSCGIISTPVGAIPEILNDENAILVQPRNVAQLKDAIEELINNPQMLSAMKGKNYSDSASFTQQAHIEALCNLYK